MSGYGYPPAGSSNGAGGYHGNYGNGGGGGGGGGYNGGYGSPAGGNYGRGGYGGGRGGSGRKRARDDDQQGQNFRRRYSERGDYHGSPRRGGYGGGHGGGGRGDAAPYDRVPSHEAMKTRFKEELWTLGNDSSYDPAIDIPSMAQSIESWFFRDQSLVFVAFRSAISEMPHKLPHYAALIARLSLNAIAPPVSLASRIGGGGASKFTPAAGQSPPRSANKSENADAGEPSAGADGEDTKPAPPEPEKVNVGHAIVQDLAKAFQAFLDERKWTSVRYCVTLFATLTTVPSTTPVVSLSSLVTLLTSFISVLDEPGLRAARGDECVRIVLEALLRLDPASLNEPGIETLREGVHAYMSSRRVEKDLFADGENQGQWLDPLEHLVSAFSSIGSADASDSTPVSDAIPNVYSALTLAPAEEDEAKSQSVEALTLPMVLVPPESDDGDLTLSAGAAIERAIPAPPITAGLRGDEGIGYDGVRLLLRLFDDETVPAVDEPAGVVVRSMVHDIISLYEVNRKDGATLLLELPRWFQKGTFRDPKAPKRPVDGDEDMPEEPAPVGPQWSLETIVVETLIVLILALPAPPHTLVYYYSVLTELCRISPTTVAPSLGKSVRKLYAALGASGGEESAGAPVLDAEGVRRFADWFAVHLSNYGFMWGWNDWAPDMDQSEKHPKCVFVKRVMDLEIRLSYFDRIKNTVPGSMLEAGVFPDEAPGPDYLYDNPEHAHNAAASSFLRTIRSKAPISETEDELNAFQKSLESENNMTPEEAERVKRDMAVQTVLFVGSRSFSHFLNALERYLTLLRNLSTSPSARQELLTTVAVFWKRHPQFHLIVLDKLLQYRLVDTRDVISWVFAPAKDQPGTRAKTWSDPDLWAMLQVTLKSVRKNVDGAKMRVEGLGREAELVGAEEDNRAGGEGVVDAEGDVAVRDAEAPENPELAMAKSYLQEAEDEQASTLIEVLGHFARLLPADVSRNDWETWWLEGWVRELCRSSFDRKSITSQVIADGIAKLDLENVSPSVASLVEAAKAWHDFA